MNTNEERIAEQTTLSRRRFLAYSGLAAASAALAPHYLLAKEEAGTLVTSVRKGAAASKITVQSLRGNISILMGSGGNIAVLDGRDGKVLVDAGLIGSRPRIMTALARISPRPTRYVINTHWHFDHTDGNAWLHAAGATIVGHENTRKRLSIRQRVADWQFTFSPAPAGARPTTVFKQEQTLRLNGTTLLLKYLGPSHTDSDISVHFPGADIIHLGDTWWNGHYPFIDYSTGGSISGMIRATEANLARVTDKTLIIPGHGPVGKKSDLVEYRDTLVAIRGRVAALKKQGRTLAEVVAAKPTAAYDAKWGDYMVYPAFFTRLVYAGV